MIFAGSNLTQGDIDSGWLIKLPPGRITLSERLTLPRGVRIEGCGTLNAPSGYLFDPKKEMP